MDSPPTTPKPVQWAVLCAVVLAGLAYGWWIFQACAPYAGGSDSAGYLNSARLLAHGEVAEPVRTVPGLVPPHWSYALYQPLGCNVDPQTGRLVPSYPVGLPLHYMIASLAVGFEKAARAVNALNALAAGLLLYALGRQLGLARRWSVAAVALLWACPIWIYQSLQPMSDSIATTWGLAAIWFALRGRTQTAWVAAAGAAFAVAVLVRPSELILLVPLAIVLGGHWRAWSTLVLGGLPFAVGLGVYNHAAYGSPFASGYNHADLHVTGLFTTQVLGSNLAYFALWVPRLLSAPVVLLAVLGWPWVFRQAPRTGVLLAGWFFALVAFYSCYFWAGETWWYLRYLLPGFPAVILTALLALQLLSARLRGIAAWLAPSVLVLGCVILQCNLTSRLDAADVRGSERHYWAACMWVKEQAPADAILLTGQLSGAVLFYNSQPSVRWDFLSADKFAQLRRAAAALRQPIYAPLFGSEKIELQRTLGGEWQAAGHAGIVTVWRLVEPGAVEVGR